MIGHLLGCPRRAAARWLTLDEASPVLDRPRAAFYTTTEIGPKRSLTPEGYLLCEEVPLCRVGEQVYAPGETPIPEGPGGYVLIMREPEEVFRPEFIRSFEGKSFTIGHPPEHVAPGNYKQYECGHVINPRRGTGDWADYLVAELLIKDPRAIQLVSDDVMREVSAGYSAEYDEYDPKGSGKGRQYNMLANHVALVKSARCGPRCAIKDSATNEDTDMRVTVADEAPTQDAAAIRTSTIRRIVDAVTAFFAGKGQTVDAATIEPVVRRVIDEMPLARLGMDSPIQLTLGSSRDEEAHRALSELKAGYDTRMAGLDDLIGKLVGHTGYNPNATGDEETAEEKADKEKKDRLGDEAPEGKADEAKKANDSSFLADAHQEAVSGAEIMMPGISVPAFDKAAKPLVTLDSICALRRRALEMMAATGPGKIVLDGLSGGRRLDFANMSCKDERQLFRAAVQAKKASKTASDAAAAEAARLAATRTTDAAGKKPIRTAKDLNEHYAKHYAPAQNQ